jgi:ABC-type glycerol-3-phosphate transport system substrate-binding protein
MTRSLTQISRMKRLLAADRKFKRKPASVEFCRTKCPSPGLYALVLVLFCAFIAGGCNQPEPEDDAAAQIIVETPDPLSMLLIGDHEELGKVIARQWSARRDGELDLQTMSGEQFAEDEFEIGREVDIIVYPPGMLGELESRESLMEVPTWLLNSDELNKNEFLRHFRTTMVRHGSETWALPLGGPQLCMLYNVETFSQLGIDVVEETATWEKFFKLLTKLEKTEVKDEGGSPISTKIEMPFSDQSLVNMFLARSAPLIRSRGKLSTVFDRSSMDPLITTEPFVTALDDLKKILGDDQAQLSLSPQSVCRDVLTGKAALGFTWPGIAFGEIPESETTIGAMSVLRLPGATQWYDFRNESWSLRATEDSNRVDLVGFDGLVASVPQRSRNTQSAFRFLEWLASKPINLSTVVQSGASGPFRASHLGDPSRWVADEVSEEAANAYGEAIRACHDESIVLMFPKILSRQRYLDSLNACLRECLEGKLTSTEALEQVAKEWNTITDSVGRAKQVVELRKDAGL